jgi:hypothetical protein
MNERTQDLESLLVLAERELQFLTEQLEEHPEIATAPAGALLLSCLEGGMTMTRQLLDTHTMASRSAHS